jgi:hypothetical protein
MVHKAFFIIDFLETFFGDTFFLVPCATKVTGY